MWTSPREFKPAVAAPPMPLQPPPADLDPPEQSFRKQSSGYLHCVVREQSQTLMAVPISPRIGLRTAAFLEEPSMAEHDSRQHQSPENQSKSELNFTKY